MVFGVQGLDLQQNIFHFEVGGRIPSHTGLDRENREPFFLRGNLLQKPSWDFHGAWFFFVCSWCYWKLWRSIICLSAMLCFIIMGAVEIAWVAGEAKRSDGNKKHRNGCRKKNRERTVKVSKHTRHYKVGSLRSSQMEWHKRPPFLMAENQWVTGVISPL